jgi:copper chaperone NosL
MLHEVYRAICLVMGAALLLAGCSGGPDTGPKEVKWDRDACERCRMVLSDRKHSAQVRWLPEGKRSRVMKFDDIGCAALWLEDKPWKDAVSTEIWVTDHRTGEWIDARSATYVKGHMTPMEYGLGAQSDAAENGLDYAQAVQHVQEVEQRFNAHGAHLQEQLKEQARQREMEHKH